MKQLLAEASVLLREGLLFRRKRAMTQYFKRMAEYRATLSRQHDGPSVEEYIARLARTPDKQSPSSP